MKSGSYTIDGKIAIVFTMPNQSYRVGYLLVGNYAPEELLDLIWDY